jgi:hypothetical protein
MLLPLERHREIYYDALTWVRVSNDLAHWVKFFLTAVIETVERGQRTFQSILALRNELGSKMVTPGRRSTRIVLLQIYLIHCFI